MKFVATLFYIFSILAACKPSLHVGSNVDKKVDFTQYKTFVIDTSRMKHGIDELNTVRIMRAISAEMVKKGYSEDRAHPDLKIAFTAVVKAQKPHADNGDSYAYGGIYRPWMWGDGGMGITGYTTVNVAQYQDGSLIIDVADARTSLLAWEGIGDKKINTPLKDPDNFIAATVSSIMTGLPRAIK